MKVRLPNANEILVGRIDAHFLLLSAYSSIFLYYNWCQVLKNISPLNGSCETIVV